MLLQGTGWYRGENYTPETLSRILSPQEIQNYRDKLRSTLPIRGGAVDSSAAEKRKTRHRQGQLRRVSPCHAWVYNPDTLIEAKLKGTLKKSSSVTLEAARLIDLLGVFSKATAHIIILPCTRWTFTGRTVRAGYIIFSFGASKMGAPEGVIIAFHEEYWKTCGVQ